MREGELPGGVLREDTQLQGSFSGSVTVPNGVHLQLWGAVGGDLTVQAGGTAVIEGAVAGSVANHGRLAMRGVIVGSLADHGESMIDPQTIIMDAT